MPDKNEVRLPESELEVMLVLWQHSQPIRTAQIMAELQKDWTLSTVKALLTRLTEKGFAEVTREGRFTLYRALVPESDYRRRETEGLLNRYYKNSVKSMVAALVSESDLSAADLQEIEEIIKNAGRQ